MTGFRAPFERSDGSCRVFAGEPATLLLRLLDADGAEQDYTGRTFRFSVVDHKGRVQASVTADTTTTIPLDESSDATVFDLTISGTDTAAMLPANREQVAFFGVLDEIVAGQPHMFFKSPFVVERGVEGDVPDETSGASSGDDVTLRYGTIFSVTQPGMLFSIAFGGGRGADGEQGAAGADGVVPSTQPKYSVHNVSGPLELDYADSVDHFVVVRAEITELTEVGTPDGGHMRIALLQDDVGNHAVTLDAGWVEGNPNPDISLNALVLSVVMLARSLAVYTVTYAVPYVPDYTLYLPLLGGTLTGNLKIAKERPILTLDTQDDDEEATIEFTRNDVGRWKVFKNTDENLRIQRRKVDGTVENSPIEIDYLTGTIILDNYLRLKGRKWLTANFQKTNNSLSTLTGLQSNVIAGGTYGFISRIRFLANVTAGLRIGVAGSATVSFFDADYKLFDRASKAWPVAEQFNALGDFFGHAGSIDGIVYVEGMFTAATDGNFRLQGAQHVTDATLGNETIFKKGSWLHIWEIAA